MPHEMERARALQSHFNRQLAEFQARGFSMAALTQLPASFEFETEQQIDELFLQIAQDEVRQAEAMLEAQRSPVQAVPVRQPPPGPAQFPTAPNAVAHRGPLPPDAFEELQALTSPEGIREIARMGPDAIREARSRMHQLLGHEAPQDIRSLTSPQALADGTYARHRTQLLAQVRASGATPTGTAPFASNPRYVPQPRQSSTIQPRGLPSASTPGMQQRADARRLAKRNGGG